MSIKNVLFEVLNPVLIKIVACQWICNSNVTVIKSYQSSLSCRHSVSCDRLYHGM